MYKKLYLYHIFVLHACITHAVCLFACLYCISVSQAYVCLSHICIAYLNCTSLFAPDVRAQDRGAARRSAPCPTLRNPPLQGRTTQIPSPRFPLRRTQNPRTHFKGARPSCLTVAFALVYSYLPLKSGYWCFCVRSCCCWSGAAARTLAIAREVSAGGANELASRLLDRLASRGPATELFSLL